MSTFLVVVIIVIGINLMNSYEKMKQFDKSINTLMNQMSGNDTDQSDNQDDTVTVNKLSGDVYPTKGDTDTSQNEDNMKNADNYSNTGSNSGGTERNSGSANSSESLNNSDDANGVVMRTALTAARPLRQHRVFRLVMIRRLIQLMYIR